MKNSSMKNVPLRMEYMPSDESLIDGEQVYASVLTLPPLTEDFSASKSVKDSVCLYI